MTKTDIGWETWFCSDRWYE